MFKVLLSLTILVSFSASAIECSLELVVNGDSNCTISAIQDCAPQSADHESDHKSHCHTTCAHAAYLPTKSISVLFALPSEKSFKQYFFLYNNPTLESPKRPPLAA